MKNDKRICICQYSLEGKFLKEYASAGLAAKENNMYGSDILNALKKKSMEAKGYMWKKSDGKHCDIAKFNPDDMTEKEKRVCDYKNRKTTQIIQMDLNGNEIKTYQSIISASKANNGLCYANIVSCAKGDRKTAGGYIWKYAA